MVSSANLEQKGDGLHFTAHSYRVLGCRYATAMLETMGITDPKVSYSEAIPEIPHPDPAEGDFVFDLNTFNPSFFGTGSFNPETGVFVGAQWGAGGWEYSSPIDLSGYKYIVAELNEPEQNHLQLRVWDTPGYFDKSYEGDFGGNQILIAELSGMMKNLDSGIVPLNSSEVYRVGFWCYGGVPIHIKHVFATNNNPYETGVSTVESKPTDTAVYNLQGIKIANSLTEISLPGLYIQNGKKYLLK